MSELTDELRNIAQQLESAPDEVLDLVADAMRIYRREEMMALGMAAIDSIVRDGPEEVDPGSPLLVAARERLRDRLRALLAWAKDTGRL